MAVGKWLYDGTVESVVHIVRRNIAYGSGDFLDPVEVREDLEGIFYYLKYFTPAEPEKLGSEVGSFDSIEQAKLAAEKTCTHLVWK